MEAWIARILVLSILVLLCFAVIRTGIWIWGYFTDTKETFQGAKVLELQEREPETKLAATMSTADSQLLAASSSASQNILKEVFVKDMDEKTGILVARITVVVIALVGVFIARDSNSSVFQIVSFAWAGFGASFGPLVLLALFWKRSNMQGALAGMVCGGVMVFVWKFLVRPMGGILGIYELLPAFLVALLANVVVSLLTAPPAQEVQEEFERVSAMK